MTDDFGLRRIRQLSMNARDLPRAVAFYRDVLGIPFLFEVPKMAFFDLDGIRLMLGVAEKPDFDHPGSILYFAVDDMGEAHRVLKERGVTFEQDPAMVADMGDHELWLAFFKDSEENHLSLLAEVAK